MIIHKKTGVEISKFPENKTIKMKDLCTLFPDTPIAINRKGEYIEVLINHKTPSESNKAKIKKLMGV